MNSLLRLIIIFVAGFAIWKLSDAFSLALDTLANPREARWFNVLSALADGVLGPGFAMVAIGLAAANKRLLLAVIIAGIALVFYVMPIVAFIIGIAIYGFWFGTAQTCRAASNRSAASDPDRLWTVAIGTEPT